MTATKELVVELVEKLIRIENEKKLLNEEQKDVFDDYKDKLDLKAVKAAIQIAKIKSRLGASEAGLDDLITAVESKITI